MEMNVENGLARTPHRIGNEPVTGRADTAIFGDGGRTQNHFAKQRFIFRSRIVERRDVFLRDNQDVGWSLRIQIFKRKDSIIFENDFGWQFAIGNLTKNTLIHFQTLQMSLY